MKSIPVLLLSTAAPAEGDAEHPHPTEYEAPPQNSTEHQRAEDIRACNHHQHGCETTIKAQKPSLTIPEPTRFNALPPTPALVFKFSLYQLELSKSSQKAETDCASKQKNCYIF